MESARHSFLSNHMKPTPCMNCSTGFHSNKMIQVFHWAHYVNASSFRLVKLKTKST